MPYIDQDFRDILDPHIHALQEKMKSLGYHEGDLNYVITRLIAFYFLGDSRYRMIARITGVLKNVSDEFYRRLAGPYEHQSMVLNGDIPEFIKNPDRSKI